MLAQRERREPGCHLLSPRDPSPPGVGTCRRRTGSVGHGSASLGAQSSLIFHLPHRRAGAAGAAGVKSAEGERLQKLWQLVGNSGLTLNSTLLSHQISQSREKSAINRLIFYEHIIRPFCIRCGAQRSGWKPTPARHEDGVSALVRLAPSPTSSWRRTCTVPR